MSVLLEEIRRIDQEAASILEVANVRTDSDIQLLSREDLQDLFRGKQEFKHRKTIFDIIHKQKPVDVLLKELQGFIPSESLKAALTGNGVLVDYLRILKNMKTQMDNVQTFLDAHINLLEDISKPEPNQELQNESKSTTSATTGPVELSNNQPYDGQQGAYGSQLNTSASGGPVEPELNQSHDCQQGTSGSQSHTSASGGPEEHLNQPHEHQQETSGSQSNTSASGGPEEPDLNQSHDCQQGTYGSKPPILAMAGQGKPYKNQTDPRALGSPARSNASGEKWYHLSQTVKYRVVVSGETFGAHVQLMDNIKALSQDRKLQLVESSQDPQIIFVFCPIVSRLATDANAALEDVKDSPGDASIILVLMHHVHEVKMVTHLRTWDEVRNVVLHIHVFYHEKEHGLLKCRENKNAVSQIQSKLLEMHPCKYISADGQDESSMSGSFTGGGNDSSSHNDADNNSGSKYSLRNVSNWFSGRK